MRRTAQIAYDLKFEGAPIVYSWPSQEGLLSYTVDENERRLDRAAPEGVSAESPSSRARNRCI